MGKRQLRQRPEIWATTLRNFVNGAVLTGAAAANNNDSTTSPEERHLRVTQ